MKNRGAGILGFIVIIIVFIGVIITARLFFKTWQNEENDFEEGHKKMLEEISEKQNEMKEETAIMEEKRQEEINQKNEEFKQKSEDANRVMFNGKFEGMQGTVKKFFLSNYLDKIVTNNKTNPSHIISVIYADKNTTTEDEIIEIKHSLKDEANYEVSINYDDNEYINQIIIKDI